MDDISSPGTRIEISDVPFAFSNEQLKSIFQKYGHIYKCQNYYRKFGKYSNLKKTGDRIIWMELKEQIPQTLKIKRTESVMYVQYPDQPRSCNNCGHTGHRMRYCNQESKDFINVIDINESDIIGRENERKKINEESDDEDEGDDSKFDEDEKEMNISVDNIDIHIDPSQTNSNFECSECSYKCKYEHIFKEHMQTHTGEKTFCCYLCEYESNTSQHMKTHMQTHLEKSSFKCEICEAVNKNKSDHEQHMLMHTNEILECEKCEYKCQNKDVLSNHLKKHNIFTCEKCEFTSNSLQGLNSHNKIHNQKQIKCSKCEVICSSLRNLNNHMKIHIGEVIHTEEISEETNTTPSKTNSTSSNTPKRCLSKSPEVVETAKKNKKK